MIEQINKEDDYNTIKNKMLNFDNGKYKNFILEKEDFTFEYGFPIFDVENREKNKPLDAIAMCSNLHKSYYASADWLLTNTEYFPGLLNLDLRLFIIVKKITTCFMITPKKDYTVPFEYTENKEDSNLLCITLAYSKNKFSIGNMSKALEYYFDVSKLKNKLEIENDNFLNSLNTISTIHYK